MYFCAECRRVLARGGVFLRGAAVLGVRCWQARSAPLKAQEGALRCGLEPQSKNAERRVFCLWLGQARSAPLKAGKVCVPIISP